MSPISRGPAPRLVFLSWHINKVSIYLSIYLRIFTTYGSLDAFHNKFYALSNFNTVKNRIFQSPFKRVNSPKHWLFTMFMGQPVRWRFGRMVRKNSGPVNFVPESPRLRFCTIHFHLLKKQLRRPESGIKDGLKKWNTNFPFGTFRPGTMKNRTTFPRSTGTTQKVVFHLLSRALIFSKLFVNGTETTTV